MQNKTLRTIFRMLNKFFMVPMFRLSLGALIGTPIGGYVMVMKMIGWKSGQTRFVPVNYAIHDGQVYCMAGWGKAAHWYRNLMADPHIELILPGRRVMAQAEDASEDPQALPILRQVLKNSGFASFMAGINPFRVSDEELRELTQDYRLLRLRPTGVVPNAADPGGWFWILVTALVIAFIWWLWR